MHSSERILRWGMIFSEKLSLSEMCGVFYYFSAK